MISSDIYRLTSCIADLDILPERVISGGIGEERDDIYSCEYDPWREHEEQSYNNSLESR
jgi:hypothetical protein